MNNAPFQKSLEKATRSSDIPPREQDTAEWAGGFEAPGGAWRKGAREGVRGRGAGKGLGDAGAEQNRGGRYVMKMKQID